MSDDVKVSILMLTHNAPEYVSIAVRSVALHTSNVEYELIVVDNASEQPTRDLVIALKAEGLIDRLEVSAENTLFAGGNNIAARLAAEDSTHFLLLNSDVEILDDEWLSNLMSHHTRGITAYGVAQDPLRVDGYCLLVDADLYRTHPLDEGHQWWWSVTKQQAVLLNGGFVVAGFGEHAKFVHHFGGMSGSAFKSAKGMNVTRSEVRSWFDGKSPVILDRTAGGEIPGHVRPKSMVSRKFRGGMKRLSSLVSVWKR